MEGALGGRDAREAQRDRRFRTVRGEGRGEVRPRGDAGVENPRHGGNQPPTRGHVAPRRRRQDRARGVQAVRPARAARASRSHPAVANLRERSPPRSPTLRVGALERDASLGRIGGERSPRRAGRVARRRGEGVAAKAERGARRVGGGFVRAERDSSQPASLLARRLSVRRRRRRRRMDVTRNVRSNRVQTRPPNGGRDGASPRRAGQARMRPRVARLAPRTSRRVGSRATDPSFGDCGAHAPFQRPRPRPSRPVPRLAPRDQNRRPDARATVAKGGARHRRRRRS